MIYDGVNMWTANNDCSVTRISPLGIPTNVDLSSGLTFWNMMMLTFDGTNILAACINSGASVKVAKITPALSVTYHDLSAQGDTLYAIH